MAKFNPLNHPICFSDPLRFLPIGWIGHVPFALTLVDLVLPRIVVELGTVDGVSYCAFCQAVRGLRLGARCIAVRGCEEMGNGAANGGRAWETFRQHHDELYRGFSRLIESSCEEALSSVEDGTVDLLHMGGGSSHAAAKRLFEAWAPKMSGRAVVLVSGTNVRQRDSHVWKFWEEIKTRYPHFEFGHAGGLGLISVGASPSDQIRQLLEAREPELSLIREFFRQQGRRIGTCCEVKQGLQGSEDELKTKEQTIELLSSALEMKTREAHERKASLESLSTELQAALKVLGAAQKKLEATADRPDTKEAQLAAILNSRAWRWVTRYGRMKNRILRLLHPPKAILLPESILTSGLKVGVDTRIPETVVVGKGNALYINGWCFHPGYEIKNLQLIVDDKCHSVKAFRMPRQDLIDSHLADSDPLGRRYRSGFWAILPLEEIHETTQVTIQLKATLSNDESCVEQIVVVTLEPLSGSARSLPKVDVENAEDEPLVAICMTTYNPPLDLFARQVQSIIDQNYLRWVCVISDDDSRPDILEEMRSIVGYDKRFYLMEASERLGFYNNFERCIYLAPSEAAFIALADHDDYWHPDKLRVLLSHFDESTTLVYSDMNIVDDKGRRLAGTYWTLRPNNYENFASLLMANTITGAASMFRKGLLAFILPFPQKIGNPYHDHWVACTALALGKVTYVNRALYDYVQHSGNAIGHYAPQKESFRLRAKGALKHFRRPKDWIHASLANWQTVYFYDLIREQVLCQVLELRCARHMTGHKRRAVRRIRRVDESLPAYLWMAVRMLKNVGRASETLGAEKVFLTAALWKAITRVKLWLRERTPGTEVPGASTQQPNISRYGTAGSEVPESFSQVQFTRQKIAPLALKTSRGAPRRVNLLIPQVDLKHLFGGYITKLNLARRLADRGFRVRMIIVDICDYLPTLWRRQLQAYDGLENLFDSIEMVYAYDRTKLLEVSEQDVFIATTWWTAHIAHAATKAILKEKFVYLIQEYEPFTFPMGTFASLANQTYQFPHYAIFSTEFLRDYFRQNRIGVFANGGGAGEHDSISFQNSITSVGKVRKEDIANRSPKRLLLYARPEAHASRNMFEMAILALSEAIKAGYFTGEWEFHGIGSVGTTMTIELGSGIQMTLLARQRQDAYQKTLRSHDLGLSLMYTPHPSLVPIEMASAGMLVVTNTFANKTASKLKEISSNIIAAEPTIEDVKLGLKEAVSNIEDYDRRVRGSHVNWNRRWEESFDKAFLKDIERFIPAETEAYRVASV